MRFSFAALVAVLSLSLLSGALARPVDESALQARSFSPADIAEINFTRGLDEDDAAKKL